MRASGFCVGGAVFSNSRGMVHLFCLNAKFGMCFAFEAELYEVFEALEFAKR